MSKLLEAIKQAEQEEDSAPVQSNPQIDDVVDLLQQNPLLVRPCLEWLRTKQAEIARLTLISLYGEKRYLEMVAEAQASK